MKKLSLHRFNMKFLIVGLGNIGVEYEGTRHNIGFDIVNQWTKINEAHWSSDRLASLSHFKFRGKEIYAIKPTTYMNLSGKAVKYWMDQERIPLKNILVILDDLSLDVGRIRIKGKGSPGGHNGLKSIEELLNTQDYNRLRFGIGNNFPKGRQAEFVLGKWGTSEIAAVEDGIIKSIHAIESWIIRGLAPTMTEFNKG
jgi:peptidyl-tRNA hydrolase, PTH1 family